MGWTLGGQAVRDAALVGGQTRWHDAGWLGGAGWTVGDRHPRLWCAWGTSASCTFCPIDYARRMRKKLQPCAWRHVAKVGPTDPASCMRCYISVLRLNRPQSATIYGFNCGLKPWAEPPTAGGGAAGRVSSVGVARSGLARGERGGGLQCDETRMIIPFPSYQRQNNRRRGHAIARRPPAFRARRNWQRLYYSIPTDIMRPA
mmetsp:Transcript_34287/g.89621  ORF Transcript_34287/g.89621 Transcript_34287/m.89621 type:complete len:202 (+) Transcript_34287:284-889(+)